MQMEGPRGVERADTESLRALTDIVFRPGMPEQYPQLYNEDNLDNLRVCVDNGKVVSHVGMTQRGALLFGCPIRVCCIGSVATHPDYRNRGLASACFDDAVTQAHADGVDVMIVSGDRHLYRSRGCRKVGDNGAYSMTREAIPPTLASLAQRISITKMTAEELPLVAECYRREPARFIRPAEDYGYALGSGWVMNRPSDFLVIRESGAFRAYVIARRPEPNRETSLSEFAGDRHAILAALPGLLRHYDAASLGFHVMGYDSLMHSLCADVGLEGTSCTTGGTYKLINFPQLMERMRPRIVELVGAKTALRLRFRQDEALYGFTLDDQELLTDRDTATYALFGTPDGLPRAIRNLEGDLGETLRVILPLPTLWYGLNYV